MSQQIERKITNLIDESVNKSFSNNFRNMRKFFNRIDCGMIDTIWVIQIDYFIIADIITKLTKLKSSTLRLH